MFVLKVRSHSLCRNMTDVGVGPLEGSVVNEDIDAAKLPHAILDQIFAMLFQCDVSGDRHGPFSGVLDPSDGIGVFAEI